MDFPSVLRQIKSDADHYINNYRAELESGLAKPGLQKLAESMSYSLKDGGKRIRPILTVLTGQALGLKTERVMPLGAAVELIHTYSLIHDDLPCMDNDDFRRGKPTNHKVFGEAMAVLAGDALNTEAFFLLSRAYSAEPALALDLVTELALSAGAQGMAGGQAADVFLKDRQAGPAEIEFLHTYKTGALFRFCILGAARIANANAFQLKCLSDYARAFGLIFQITDDIADGDKATDEPSFVKAVGLDKAHQTCQQLVLNAQQAVESFGKQADGLKYLASHLYERVKA